MRIQDLLHETYFAITMNKARSGLTILGIVIGIASVIAMVSIGQGAQLSIEQSIQSIGSNLLMIYPGFQRGVGEGVRSGRGSAQTLTKEDAEAIEQELSFINAVSPETSGRYQVTAKGENTNTSIVGTVPSYIEVKNFEMDLGLFISEQDMKRGSKVAVLGPTTRDDLFGEDVNPVGQKIRINRIDFTVIGVTRAKGTTGFQSQDDMILIPLSTFQLFLSGDDYITSISIQVEDEKFMSAVEEQINGILLARHNISDPQLADFQIMNQADILETATSVTNTFTIFLGAIAGISLIVGGIGIMNMMLTTVTERTREIGLRKAIGAKSKDINMQFLTEAVMFTFIGGIIGIILGTIISLAISRFADINTDVSMFSVLLAFSVSAIIGIGFGYYPAKRAASLNPIEALRYE
jgi:putative ABC transport system permease protein